METFQHTGEQKDPELDVPKRVRTLHFAHIALSTRQHSSVVTETFQGCDSSREGKWEPLSECPASPAARKCYQTDPLPSHSIQNTEVCCTTGETGRGEELGECHIGLLGGIKGTQIILLTS